VSFHELFRTAAATNGALTATPRCATEQRSCQRNWYAGRAARCPTFAERRARGTCPTRVAGTLQILEQQSSPALACAPLAASPPPARALQGGGSGWRWNRRVPKLHPLRPSSERQEGEGRVGLGQHSESLAAQVISRYRSKPVGIAQQARNKPSAEPARTCGGDAPPERCVALGVTHPARTTQPGFACWPPTTTRARSHPHSRAAIPRQHTPKHSWHEACSRASRGAVRHDMQQAAGRSR